MRHASCSSPRRVGPALLVAGLALLASGCPDRITDPDRFLDASGPTDASPGMDAPVMGNCALGDNYVETMLLPSTCAISGCHSAMSPQNGLDLTGTDAQLASRLVGMQGSSACGHMPWIDATDPSHSLILLKVMASPPCGSRMPVGSTLNAMQVQCLSSWVQSLASGSGGGGTDAGGSDASGTGG